jgi:hypothetical protein
MKTDDEQRETMTDRPTEDQMQPGVFDDDRLLACALGLDDDPELLTAAETDAGLAARLAAMRADVAAVGTQIAAAVPTPDAAYADVSHDRWSGLSEFFERPASATKPRRAGRWWRVAAPVAAVLVLALVAGIVAVDRGSQSRLGGDQAATTAESGSSDAAAPSADRASGFTSATEQFTDQLDHFAVVVLARARAASGALQRFAVVRIFKGEAPKVVELAIGGQPADQGRLHLLMLDPDATGVQELTAPQPVESHSPIKSGYGAPGQALDVAYTYNGEPTMVREFAAGTDPDMVSLPIP